MNRFIEVTTGSIKETDDIGADVFSGEPVVHHLGAAVASLHRVKGHHRMHADIGALGFLDTKKVVVLR